MKKTFCKGQKSVRMDKFNEKIIFIVSIVNNTSFRKPKLSSVVKIKDK